MPAETQTQRSPSASASALSFAICGSRHAVGPDVVVAVGANALLFFWRGHADPAPQSRPGPRFDATRGLSRGTQETRNSPGPGLISTSPWGARAPRGSAFDCVISTIGATAVEPKQRSGRSATPSLLLRIQGCMRTVTACFGVLGWQSGRSRFVATDPGRRPDQPLRSLRASRPRRRERECADTGLPDQNGTVGSASTYASRRMSWVPTRRQMMCGVPGMTSSP